MTVLNVIVEVCYDGDPEKAAVTKRFEEALEYARQEGMLSVLGVFPAETACDWLTVLGVQDAVDPATARIAKLEKRLRDIAAGARSKADLIASGSPTSIYTKPVDVLRALAKECEEGQAPDPHAGMDTLEALKKMRRQLTAMEKKMDDPHGDGSGTDARAPDGDDYNRLFNLMEGGLIALIRRLNPNDPEI